MYIDKFIYLRDLGGNLEVTTLPLVDANYAQSRLVGSELNTLGRAISLQKDKLSSEERQLQKRKDEGLGYEGTQRRVDSLRANITADELRYQEISSSLGQDRFRQAIKDAPKRYREDRLSERSYNPGGEGPGKSESRSYFQAKELASKQPGIYEYKTGGAFVSSAGDGSFVNDQGEVIQIRSPIGQRTDKSFIYSPKDSGGRVVTGLVLSGESGQAVRQVVNSGKYSTAGSLFAGVTASSMASFGAASPVASASSFGSRARSSILSFGQGEAGFFGAVKRASVVPYVGLFAAGDAQSRAATGSKNPNRLLYSNPLNTTSFNAFVDRGNTVPFYFNPTAKITGSVVKSTFGVASGIVDFPNEVVKDPYGSARKATIVTGLSYIGGQATGAVVSRVAARSVAKASFIDTGLKTVLGGTLAYQTATDPVSVGREAPYIILGGVAFEKAFTARAPSRVEFAGFERTNPRSEQLPKFFETETTIRPQEFAAVGRGKAKFSVIEYGQQRTVTSDVLSVTRGGRAYSQTTGRALNRYNVEQSTSFSDFTFKGKPYRIPAYEQSGYVSGKETALVDRRGFVTLSRQARNLDPTNRVGLTKFATVEREYGEVYQTFGERFSRRGSNQIAVSQTFTRGNVETGFGYDVFKLQRRGVVDVFSNGRSRARTVPYRLGSRSERFEFVTVLGRDKSLSGSIIRDIKPFERRAIGKLQERGLLQERFGFDAKLGRRGELVSSFRELNPRIIEKPRYTSRSPRLQFYQELSVPNISRSLFSGFRFIPGTVSSSRQRSSGALASFASQRSGLVSTQDVIVQPRNRSLIDVRSTQSVLQSSAVTTRSIQLSRLQPLQSSFTILVDPDIPPPELPGFGGFGVPLFGVGGGRSVSGSGRGRKFKYAPSLNAVIFNIKGRKENKRLTGFETRPILAR